MTMFKTTAGKTMSYKNPDCKLWPKCITSAVQSKSRGSVISTVKCEQARHKPTSLQKPLDTLHTHICSQALILDTLEHIYVARINHSSLPLFDLKLEIISCAKCPSRYDTWYLITIHIYYCLIYSYSSFHNFTTIHTQQVSLTKV